MSSSSDIETSATSGPGPSPDEVAPPVDAVGAKSDTVPRRRLLLAAAVAALFAVVSVFLAVVAAGLNSDLDRERSDRQAVTRTAGDFSAALLTYDHERLDEARDRVLALSTGRFHREYEEAFAGLSELIRTSRSRAAATVKDVFVGEIDGATARVVTVVDADIEGRSGRRQAIDSYILLDLVKIDSEWKVDGVTSLNFTRGGLPAPPGTEDADSTSGTEE